MGILWESPCQAATIHHSALCPELRCHVCPGQMLKSYWGETQRQICPGRALSPWPLATTGHSITDHSTPGLALSPWPLATGGHYLWSLHSRPAPCSLPAHDPWLSRVCLGPLSQLRGCPTKINFLNRRLFEKGGNSGHQHHFESTRH